MKEGWKAVIGLEIHAQLNTRSKMFCADPVEFGAMPNTMVSPITLGHPGTLPSPNHQAVHLAIQMGLATGCSIAPYSYFARKHYFYPDLPKGYQVSQDKTPICVNGHLDLRLKDGNKHIRIQRIHIEEDAGKSIHDQDMYDSLIDLNRAGVGLIEIVSEPDMEDAVQAMAYLGEIRKLVRYIGVCDGNMEEGSMRCDANVSVMRLTDTQLGTRCEIKNINSISNLGKAILYEIDRQIDILENGGRIVQQTRSWDAPNSRTVTLRDKESADDYRYFPEPDLLPVVVDDELLNRLRAELPELPEALYQKFVNELKLTDFDAQVLTEQREFAQYFQQGLKHSTHAKQLANWLIVTVRAYLNEVALDIERFPLSPERMAQLVDLVEEGKVSHTAAKEQLFPLMLQHPELEPKALAAAHSLLLETNTDEIRLTAAELLAANPDKVKTYLDGKTGLLGFFVGQLMRQTGGRADPKAINTIVIEELEKLRA